MEVDARLQMLCCQIKWESNYFYSFSEISMQQKNIFVLYLAVNSGTPHAVT